MALLETTIPVTSVLTASATLAAGQHSLVSASGGPKTMTLPNAAHQGSRLRVEKVDGSGNAVTVQGTIRGSASGSVDLTSQYEVIEFWAETTTSWRPINDRRSDSSIQAMIDSSVTDDVATAVAGAIQGTVIKLQYDVTAGWPTRPDTSSTGQSVMWVGPSATPVADNGTSGGGTAAAAPGDLLFYS